jgi:hypothetical protein
VRGSSGSTNSKIYAWFHRRNLDKQPTGGLHDGIPGGFAAYAAGDPDGTRTDIRRPPTSLDVPQSSLIHQPSDDSSMPDYRFGRCDGHHKMVDCD